MQPPRVFLASLCLPILALSGPSLHAEDAAVASSDRGAPPEKAVSIGLGYKLDVLRSRGGMNDGRGTLGNLDFRLRADLNEILGWKDGIAYLQIIHDHGDPLNAGHTGSLMGVSNIEVPVNTTKIFHAWVQQNFLDNSLSLLAGLYPIDAEFGSGSI